MSSPLLRWPLALGLALWAIATLSGTDAPPRLRRADSFLGIHFDFHAGPDCMEVGRNTTPSMIHRIIDLVRPDYLQIDCKGHPGYSSYPTQVGQPVPGFVGDPLRTWREVTAARGVGLYLHYSGVWDGQAVKRSGWAAIDAEGNPSTKATSFWGPYVDTLLIPQLRELAGRYGADGVWIDGDCWAAVPDYRPEAIAAFQAATGFKEIPRKPGDPHWYEFLQFHREAFRGYVRHYLSALKATHPNFQICSNWAFTDHMPEPVSAPLDFLSGDYAPDDSVNSARLSGRYLARQGVPWDLMAWSFSNKQPASPRPQKSVPQLQREAAIVLALGGGFQAYFKQKRDGSIFDEQMPVMAEVAAFCRARQELSHHGVALPQIALLLSTEDQYRRNNGLFSRNLTRVRGVLQALLEKQQSVEVLGEHQLSGRLAEYPLVVVPECDTLTDAFREELTGYVSAGGRLLLIGAGSAAMFARVLDIRLTSGPQSSAPFSLSNETSTETITTRVQPVTLGRSSQPYGQLQATASTDSPALPAASFASHGKGRIAAVYFSAGQVYAKDRPAAVREFLHAVVRQLFPAPLVEVTGSPDIDVVPARKQGRLLVHLVNTSGPHATQGIIENITPVGPLQVSIRHPRPPRSVTLQPSGRPIQSQYQNGRIEVVIPSVAIHEIIVVTP